MTKTKKVRNTRITKFGFGLTVHHILRGHSCQENTEPSTPTLKQKNGFTSIPFAEMKTRSGNTLTRNARPPCTKSQTGMDMHKKSRTEYGFIVRQKKLDSVRKKEQKNPDSMRTEQFTTIFYLHLRARVVYSIIFGRASISMHAKHAQTGHRSICANTQHSTIIGLHPQGRRHRVTIRNKKKWRRTAMKHQQKIPCQYLSKHIHV